MTITIEAVAGICHGANRGLCINIGDNSQPHWTDAPAWQRESAINGVRFHLDNPEATEAASHENWLREKEAAGWRYGAVKDPDAKAHPCFVPFSDLPPEQQAKDRLFKAVVDALRHLVKESP